MDSEYSIQERKAIRTTKTGLSDDLVSSIESCSPLPLEYVRNVCVDGRNTIFIKPLARNVCQIIMIKSWKKVSFREKESKKEKLFQNHFLLILIYYHKPKWRRFVFLLYVYCTRCFLRGMTTLTKAVWAVLWITLCPPGNFVHPPEFFGGIPHKCLTSQNCFNN